MTNEPTKDDPKTPETTTSPTSEAAPPRRLTAHALNGANEQLVIEVLDGEGAGGANHLYQVSGFSTKTNPSCPFQSRYGQPADHATILFQNGPIQENGVNGVTHEVLLAIVADRLERFQAGKYSCEENRWALAAVQQALHCLKLRTQRRLDQGIEGTMAGA